MSTTSLQEGLTYQAAQGYLPMHDGEIELVKGDIIAKCKDLNNGWTLGRNISRDSVGIFPSDFIILASLDTLNVALPKSNKDSQTGKRDSHKRLSQDNILFSNGIDQQPDLIIQDSHDKNGSKLDQNGPGLNQADSSQHTYERISAGLASPPLGLQRHSCNGDNFQPESTHDCLTNPLTRQQQANTRKPHMLVKPNLGKNMFRQPSETTVKSVIENGSAGSDDGQESPRCQRHSLTGTPPLNRATPPRMRITNPPIGLPNVVVGATIIPNESVDSALPGTSGTSSSNDLPTDPDIISPSEQSEPVSPSVEATERENIANELSNISPIHQNGLTKNQKFANIRHHRFYQDYRTLECPPIGGSPQPHLRYKPILKNKTGQYGNGTHRNANEIYYREEPDEQRSVRVLMSFLAGLFVGFVIFLWMHYGLEYSFMIALLVSCISAVLLILAFSCSKLCRCIAALLIPSICTTRGRIAFLIIITGFLLDGPVTNIYWNMAETSRSMSCSAEQSYNQSMLLLQPFDTMMQQLNHTVDRLTSAAREIDTGLAPLDHGMNQLEIGLIEGDIALSATEQTCRKVMNSAFDECAEGIEEAQRQCVEVAATFGSIYYKALDALEQIKPFDYIEKHVALHKRQAYGADSTLASVTDKKDVCEPLENVVICQALNDSDVLCEPSGWAGEAIQDAINSTQRAMTQMKNSLRFNVNPEPYFTARLNATRTTYKVRREVETEFYYKTIHFSFVISILKKLIPISIILLIYVAYVHVKNYICKETYDNVYITPQFKSLDQKRTEVAGESLLPLKKYERNYLIDTTLSELSPPEDGLYRIGLCVLLLHILLSFICYFFDYVLYWILAMVRKYGDLGMDYTGKDSLEYIITGEGVFADLLHVFLKGFHPANLFGYTLDTHHCLPKPDPPSIAILMVMFLLYFILILTILLKAYILRFRNRITAYFYPDHEKARIVHIYNVVLNHRYRMPKLLQQRARMNYREHQMREQISVLHRMAAKLPPCRIFVYNQQQCLVCGCDEEPTFRDCQTDHCQGNFCAECHDDLGRICPLCHQTSEYSDDEEYDDLEDDLQPYCRSSKIYV